MQSRLEKRFSRGISGLASYTWGKALTNAVDHLSTSGAGNGVDVGAFREPQEAVNRRLEYGPAEFDMASIHCQRGLAVPCRYGLAEGARISRPRLGIFLLSSPLRLDFR